MSQARTTKIRYKVDCVTIRRAGRLVARAAVPALVRVGALAEGVSS